MRTMTMTTMMMLMMVVMTVLVGMGDSQRRNDVCTPTSGTSGAGSSVKKPSLPQTFKVDVECNILERNTTVYVKEYYDLQMNRGRLTKTRRSGVTEYYMDYDHDLLLQVDPKTGQCDAGLLMLAPDRFMFGFRMKGLQSQMFLPSAALHFGGNTTETFVNQTVVRGIPVDHWRSCQYIDSISATAQVDWYFSRMEDWSMQEGAGTSPVRMTAHGKMVLNNQTVVPFSHVYDFFNFKPFVYDSDFQVPDGVFCPGRTLVDKPKPFPSLPYNFYFVGENADNYGHRYNILEEYYDDRSKLAMYRYKLDLFNLTGVNRYTELNDYNTGVSYSIDNSKESCQLSPITQATMSYSVPVNSKEVRMSTPRELFLDNNMVYQYIGNATVRNMQAERWVGVTDKAKGFKGKNVTVVWYFATSRLNSWNNGVQSQYRTPLQLRVFLPKKDMRKPSVDFNIFYYNVKTATFSDLDITPCFKRSQQLPLHFVIPKSKEAVIRRNVEQTKVAIQTAISLHTGISFARISDVQLYFNEDSVEVTLDLLGKPPSFGDVEKASLENSLCAAAKLLNDSFNDDTFTIDFDDGTTVETVTPDKWTLAAMSTITCGDSSDSQYSAGLFAGLGVGMLVVGGAGGGIGSFIFFK